MPTNATLALDLTIDTDPVTVPAAELARTIPHHLNKYGLLGRELRPGDCCVIRTEADVLAVRRCMEQFAALEADQQRSLPALLNGLALLEAAAAEYAAARQDFVNVADLVTEPAARAEACHNAYVAGLEEGDWDEALANLREAAGLDPERFAPFPMAKFEPERILGAGGPGITFLCRSRPSGSRVVVKALRTDTLGREVDDLFREARALDELEHPAIIRLRDCDWAGPGQSRPYLVMDYFEGQTLADYVAGHGPLTPDRLVELAGLVADALAAAHGRDVLHRDLRPSNVLVRWEGEAPAEPWARRLGGSLALPGNRRRLVAC